MDSVTLDTLRGLLDGARRVVVTCHVSPDGDAIGSSLAMMHMLRHRNIDAQVVTPDMPPRILGFLPGAKSIVVASASPIKAAALIADADLVVCLDFNALMRVDKMRPLLEQSTAPKVLIDHHLDPESFATVTISHPEIPATCMLLYQVFQALGWDADIDRRAALCLLTGILTDTGGLTYNANRPDLYETVAALLRHGIDKDQLYKQLFDTCSEERLRLCAWAIYRKMWVMPEHRLALVALSRKELDEFGYQRGDTESLVNRPLSMPGCTWSVFLREDAADFVKVSMRSKGHFPVNRVCEDLFGGGGHENAAGGEFYGTLPEAIDTLLAALPNYDKYL